MALTGLQWASPRRRRRHWARPVPGRTAGPRWTVPAPRRRTGLRHKINQSTAAQSESSAHTSQLCESVNHAYSSQHALQTAKSHFQFMWLTVSNQAVQNETHKIEFLCIYVYICKYVPICVYVYIYIYRYVVNMLICICQTWDHLYVLLSFVILQNIIKKTWTWFSLWVIFHFFKVSTRFGGQTEMWTYSVWRPAAAATGDMWRWRRTAERHACRSG